MPQEARPQIVQYKSRRGVLSRGLSGFELKLIAIVCMTLDHIAWGFLTTETAPAQILHFFGRVTAPVMCFFISEGYHRTKDLKKYAIRILVFAVISRFAFCYFETGHFLAKSKGSVMETLAISLLCVAIFNGGFSARDGSSGLPAYSFRLPLIALLCVFAEQSDWGMRAVLFTMTFEAARKFGVTKQGQAYLLAALCVLLNAWGLRLAGASGRLYMLGLFLPVPLIMLYNGKRGGERIPQVTKWLFYVYYPAHLILLGFLRPR